jgi:ribosome-associated protein
MKIIEINTDTIQLDQLLKWGGIINSGGQMKFLIEEEKVKLNGEIVTAKRKKIVPGDIVEVTDQGVWQVQKQGD